YVGRTAGNCRSGHPESLMCWGGYGPRRNPDEFSTLWEDDITGIQANWRQIKGEDLTPPEWAGEIDLIGPLDLDEPWPGAGGTEMLAEQFEVTVIDGGATPIDTSAVPHEHSAL